MGQREQSSATAGMDGEIGGVGGDDIDANIDADIDRNAGYDHETASEIQTTLAKLGDRAEEIADEVNSQTDQITDINGAIDELVTDLSGSTAAGDD